MPYLLRLNGDPELQLEVEHVVEAGENEVKIKDDVTFPAGMIPDGARIEKAELFDEKGDRWAMRRIPRCYAPVVHNCIAFTFNWTLHIEQEVKGTEPGTAIE